MEINSGNRPSGSDPPTPIDSELLAETLPDISISTENCNSVYFDLETSGFGKDSEILQIAAKFKDYKFNVYLKPSKPINHRASEVTGLKNICGELYLNDKHVSSIPPREALQKFQEFLDLSPKPCVLVAHNASFDAFHLLQLIINTNMIENLSKIAGFSDTLIVFRRNYPERKDKFTLRALAQDLLHLQPSDGFHEALYDVEILEKLVNETLIKKEDLYAICKPYKKSVMLKIPLPSLKKHLKGVSNNMLKKIAAAGINLEMLQRELRESGEEGIKSLLSEELALNKPRVTKNKRVINDIILSLKTLEGID